MLGGPPTQHLWSNRGTFVYKNKPFENSYLPLPNTCTFQLSLSLCSSQEKLFPTIRSHTDFSPDRNQLAESLVAGPMLTVEPEPDTLKPRPQPVCHRWTFARQQNCVEFWKIYEIPALELRAVNSRRAGGGLRPTPSLLIFATANNKWRGLPKPTACHVSRTEAMQLLMPVFLLEAAKRLSWLMFFASLLPHPIVPSIRPVHYSVQPRSYDFSTPKPILILGELNPKYLFICCTIPHTLTAIVCLMVAYTNQ